MTGRVFFVSNLFRTFLCIFDGDDDDDDDDKSDVFVECHQRS